MRNALRSPSFLPRALVAALVAALLVLPASAWGHDPPNPNDPCSKAGRDSCGTTGVGFYKTYSYGLRWFGDYKGLPNGELGFCIDLGYWYPDTSYHYTPETAVLVNSYGRTVPLVNRQKIAYAAWAYGRSTNPDREAAVMLYIHGLMGDARPGEVDPSSAGPGPAGIYKTVAADAIQFHGPYRIETHVNGTLKVGEATTATIRVLAASGSAMPGATFELSAEGASGVPKTITADPQGVATISFTPTASTGVKISVTATGLASTEPNVYAPAVHPAATNAQRLIAPTSQTVNGTIAHTVSKGHVTVATTATPATVVAGHVVRDHVEITGAPAGWQATLTATIHGPFASTGEINCTKKVWSGTFDTNGSGTYLTPKTAVNATGWYVFEIIVPSDATTVGTRTSCSDSAERFFVQAEPTLATTASSPSESPGTPIFDRVEIGSLAGTTVTATVDLFGPFPAQDKVSCDAAPIWSGTVTAKANGAYKTETFTPTVPGIYTYRAQIPTTELVRGSQGACGETAETTAVLATPKVSTRASASVTRPGSQILDQVNVTGTGALTVTVDLELFGPFDTRSGISCDGKPLWTGTVTAKGDGTYLSGQVTLQKAGYYVFRESIPATAGSKAFTGPCGETPETTLASAKPTVTTQASSDVVRPGAGLTDKITVSGLGQTEAAVQVQLYGPFATVSAISCTGKPYAQTVVTAHGDSTFHSPAMKITSAGFYTFHETLQARPNVAEVDTPCAVTAETSLGAPAIITGRGDITHLIAVRTERPNRPVRVQIASLGIDAPVVSAGIDVKQGVLAVPADIHKTGWWADGAAPGDPTGSVIIAGHVDSAAAGAGAFFALKDARPGTTVQVTTADGQTKSYKVVSVKRMLKAQLPTAIWSQTGKNHLELVTCGGPFDTATGHYRDNIVVTAVPA